MYYFLIISSFLLGLAYLWPIHNLPYIMYTEQILSFISLFLLSLYFLNKKLEIPSISIPLLFITTIPLLQYSFGLIYFSETAILSSCFIFAFFLSIIYGYNLKIDYDFLLYTIIICALISCIIAFSQWLGFGEGIFVAKLVGNRPFANFLQPNNLSTFLLIGFFCNFYLRKNFNKYIFITTNIIILFGLALTYSRTGWITLILVSFIIIFRRKENPKLFKEFPFYMVIFFTFLITIPYLNQILHFFDYGINTENLTNRLTTGGSRFDLWYQQIIAVFLQPWFGYGWNQTAFAQLTATPDFYRSYQTSSAHNLILELIVWNGIPLGVFINIFFLYLFYIIFFKSKKSIFIKFIIFTFFLHSLLEFPQNYAFFLFPIGFFIGSCLKSYDVDKFIFKYNYIFSASIFILLYLTQHDYFYLKNMINTLNRNEYRLENKENIFVLTHFSKLVEIYFLPNKTRMEYSQLKEIYNFTLVTPHESYLRKLIIVSIYNHQSSISIDAFNILNSMYPNKYRYNDLKDLALKD